MLDQAISRVSWPAVPDATSYSVSRGSLDQIGATEFGVCVVSGSPDLFYDDSLVPPGLGLFYIVTAASCETGTLGTGSDAVERINMNPGACP